MDKKRQKVNVSLPVETLKMMVFLKNVGHYKTRFQLNSSGRITFYTHNPHFVVINVV
jgi:hypothetical protein